MELGSLKIEVFIQKINISIYYYLKFDKLLLFQLDIDNKDYKSLTERALVELFNSEDVLFGAGERFTRNQMKRVSHSSYH